MIEVTTVVVIVVVAVVLFYLWWRSRPDYSLANLRITASRDPVLVGQATDIRFHFTVDNPGREALSYEATLDVEGSPEVQQNNSFTQHSLSTTVPRLGTRWPTPGAKRVAGTVRVGEIAGRAEGEVHVLAQEEEDE